ncbi:MAG: flagellum-specific ATP synthase FliI, partial [Blastomonas fulva]
MIAAQEEAVRQFTDKVAALGAGPRRVGRLVAHEGGMLEVTGFDYPIGYGGSVRAADGRRIRAEIAGFRGSRAMMVPLESDAALRSGARGEPDPQAH